MDGRLLLEDGANGPELTRGCFRGVLKRFEDGVGGGGTFNSVY